MSVFQASTARKKTTAGLGIEMFLTFTLISSLFMYVCMYVFFDSVSEFRMKGKCTLLERAFSRLQI